MGSRTTQMVLVNAVISGGLMLFRDTVDVKILGIVLSFAVVVMLATGVDEITDAIRERRP